MPIRYRNEITNTAIVKAVLKNLCLWKLPPAKFNYSTVDVLPTGVLFNCPKMPHDEVNRILNSSTALLSIGEVEICTRDRDSGKEKPVKYPLLQPCSCCC